MGGLNREWGGKVGKGGTISTKGLLRGHTLLRQKPPEIYNTWQKYTWNHKITRETNPQQDIFATKRNPQCQAWVTSSRVLAEGAPWSPCKTAGYCQGYWLLSTDWRQGPIVGENSCLPHWTWRSHTGAQLEPSPLVTSALRTRKDSTH